jgi:hypothetical protein
MKDDPAPETPDPDLPCAPECRCGDCLVVQEIDKIMADGEMTTASAVLQAGDDQQLKLLRLRLKAVGSNISNAEIHLELYREEENATLDAIAARMDQLKKGKL